MANRAVGQGRKSNPLHPGNEDTGCAAGKVAMKNSYLGKGISGHLDPIGFLGSIPEI